MHIRVTLVSLLAIFAGCTATGARSLEESIALDRDLLQHHFRALPELERAAVWDELLAITLADEPLTAEQREFLESTRAHLDDALADPDAFGARATELFGEDRAHALFAEGRLVAAAIEPPALMVGAWVAPTAADGLAREEIFVDACNTRWNCGGCRCSAPFTDCQFYVCSSGCTSTNSGCGWFWSQSCTRSEEVESSCGGL